MGSDLAGQVLERARMIPDGLEPLCPHTWHIRGEVLHAVREEMAGSLADILDRRLGLLHSTPCHAADAAETAARIAAPLLGWDDPMRIHQIETWQREAGAKVSRP